MAHLWEIDHPYYGCCYKTETFGSFTELRDNVNRNDEDMNFVYRWDWFDYSQPQHDDLFLPGEDRSGQKLVLSVLMPRIDNVVAWECPITHEQEGEVLEFLRSPRVLGTLRKWWDPILGEVDQ